MQASLPRRQPCQSKADSITMGAAVIDKSDADAARPLPFIESTVRAADFWRRTTTIYASYKLTQLHGGFMALTGADAEAIKDKWDAQHTWAGEQMYNMCIDLRGFYLKAGQFIGSRGDFVPEQICRKLALLCDKVPPMPGSQVKLAIQKELGLTDLSEVFEWIDLDKPLGSASVAQVHKAKLRQFSWRQLSKAGKTVTSRLATHVVGQDQDAWSVCNLHGMSFDELAKLNKGVDINHLQPGQPLKVRVLAGIEQYGSDILPVSLPPAAAAAAGLPVTVSGGPVAVVRLPDSTQGDRAASNALASTSVSSSGSAAGGGSGSGNGGRGRPGAAVAAVLHATANGDIPKTGLVAVKVQYPDALPMMQQDLINLRAASYYLSKTEIKFDLVSAVDELNKQIKLEFDFTREARVMDTISEHLRHYTSHIQVPRSVHGLVTPRLLVMSFLEGTPLTDAAEKMGNLPERAREAGKKLILKRVSEAYGRMILGEGLFQADGHPGNILIGKGGRIGLLDYGQSKQLRDSQRHAFAELVLALHAGRDADVSKALWDLGVITERDDPEVRAKMAYGMFDTRGKVDPFDPNSPIKQCAISSFPPDLFFVLRVVQLLRGMANGMGIDNFSSADQWTGYAQAALRQRKQQQRKEQFRSWRRHLTHTMLAPFGHREPFKLQAEPIMN